MRGQVAGLCFRKAGRAQGAAFLQAVVLAFCLARPVRGGGPPSPSISLAFWNDTADAERFLREGLNRAQDDYLTAAWEARLAWQAGRVPCDLAWNTCVVTLKERGRRTDLGSLRLGASLHLPRGELHVATGLMGRGRFGGEGLQNGYHGLSGNPRLELAYPAATHLGPVLEERYTLSAPGKVGQHVALALMNLDAPAAGYHRSRVLLQAKAGMTQAAQVEACLGLARYRHLDAWLRPAFQDGMDYGALLRWSIRPRLHLSCWALANPTRKDQTIPGLSLAWGALASGSQLTGLALFP